MKYFILIFLTIFLITSLLEANFTFAKAKKTKKDTEEVSADESSDKDDGDSSKDKSNEKSKDKAKDKGSKDYVKRDNVNLNESKEMKERKDRDSIGSKSKTSYYWIIPKASVNTDGFPVYGVNFGVSFSALMNLKWNDFDIKFGLYYSHEEFKEKVNKVEFKETNHVKKTDVMVGELFEFYNARLFLFQDLIMWNYDKDGFTTIYEYNMQNNIDEISQIINPGFFQKIDFATLLVFGGYKFGISSDTGNIDIRNVNKFSFKRRTYNVTGYNAGISLNLQILELLFAYEVFDVKLRKNSSIADHAGKVFPFVASSQEYTVTSYGLTVFFNLKELDLSFTGVSKLPAIMLGVKKNITDYDNARPQTSNFRFEFGLQFK